MMALNFSNFALFVGFCGLFFYLASYALLQLRFIKGNGYAYPLLNGAAATCILVSLFRDFNMASLLTQISFILISLFGISRLFYIRNKIKFDEREIALRDEKLPNLQNDVARKFFDQGEWLDVPNGATLCEAGKPVDYLYYIEDGECSVKIGRKLLGTCGKGDFVGEITCFTDDFATGTVKTNGDVHLFRISADDLKEICTENPTIRTELESGIANNLRTKFIRTNKAPAKPAKKISKAYQDRLSNFSRDLNEFNV